MLLGDAHVLATLSTDWVRAVKQSGRFASQKWDRTIKVPITTVDKLIDCYGVPDFMKIDVEGFEYEVVSGLSRPVPTISLEFMPEWPDSIRKSIAHLRQLADVAFNYSLGETMQFGSGAWVSAKEILEILERFQGTHAWGDIYVRSTEHPLR